MSNAMLLYAHHSDGELVEKVRMGQKACFEVLVRRHSQVLYRIGRMFGLPKDDTELVICDTHLNALNALPRMRKRIFYRTWLISAMISKCKAKMQNLKSGGGNAIDPAAAPVRSTCHYEWRQEAFSVTARLEDQLDSLPLAARSAFVMCEIEGYSEAETAEFLHIAGQSVRSNLSYANARLQRASRSWHDNSAVYTLDAYGCEWIVEQVMKIAENGIYDTRVNMPSFSMPHL